MLHIGESDIFEICGYLHGLDKRSISSIGLCLGLSYAKVEDILQSPTYREDIIAAWIQRQDQVLQKSGAPTWLTLVKALKNPQVGQGGIASDISRDKKIRTSSSTESGIHTFISCRIKITQSTKMGVVFVRPGDGLLYFRVSDSIPTKNVPEFLVQNLLQN